MRLSRLAISRRIAAIALYARPVNRDPQLGERRSVNGRDALRKCCRRSKKRLQMKKDTVKIKDKALTALLVTIFPN